MRHTRCKKGLSLVELLVAIVVTSIIMTAVAALAFAMGSANDSADDTSQKQAQIRFATLRISELIRHSKLICYVHDNELAVWRADDVSGGANRINLGELTYIETDSNRIRLMEFSSVPSWLRTWPFSLAHINWLKAWFMSYCTESYTVLIPECSNVQFAFAPAVPPRSQFVTISFDIEENGITHRYQINAALLGWAGNLLSDSNDIAGDDD